MLLDKSEDLLQLSVKQSAMKSRSASKPYFPRSGYIWYVKNQMLMFVAKVGVFVFNKGFDLSWSLI